MASYEHKGQLSYVDYDGNEHILYPETEIDCVHGLNEELGAKAPISHTEDKNNPHGVTAEQAGARPNTWLPTIAEIGAAPANRVTQQMITTEGWYRAGTINCYNSFVIRLSTIYDGTTDMATMLDVVVPYRNARMRQLTAKTMHATGLNIDQVRLVSDDTTTYKFFVDFHCNSEINNTVRFSIDGADDTFEQQNTFTKIADNNIGGTPLSTIALELS